MPRPRRSPMKLTITLPAEDAQTLKMLVWFEKLFQRDGGPVDRQLLTDTGMASRSLSLSLRKQWVEEMLYRGDVESAHEYLGTAGLRDALGSWIDSYETIAQGLEPNDPTPVVVWVPAECIERISNLRQDLLATPKEAGNGSEEVSFDDRCSWALMAGVEILEELQRRDQGSESAPPIPDPT